MLNIPQKSQRLSSGVEILVSPSASKLEQLNQLRNKVNQLEQLIEQIMPLAIDEAIDILSKESAINGKNVVYSQKDKGKITVTFRKQYPNVRDYVVLQRLDEEIKAEQ